MQHGGPAAGPQAAMHRFPSLFTTIMWQGVGIFSSSGCRVEGAEIRTRPVYSTRLASPLYARLFSSSRISGTELTLYRMAPGM